MSDVVLVHGAWHGAWCWAQVVDELDALGVSHDAVELPLTGLVDDAATVRDAIESAVERAGPGVVVVGHSYGGIVISQAAAGVDGVGRLVYLAAFMTDEGEDELSIMTAHESPVLGAVVVVDGGAAIDPAQAPALFYGDSDAATVAKAVPLLRPMRGGGRLRGRARVEVDPVHLRGVHRGPRVAARGSAGDGHARGCRRRMADRPFAVPHPPRGARGVDRRRARRDDTYATRRRASRRHAVLPDALECNRRRSRVSPRASPLRAGTVACGRPGR